jgi:propanol-preferring alcohol dehydrogenase
VLLRVRACAVCRTDLHIVDGELTEPKLPLVPGHQIVGEVIAVGADVRGLSARRPGRGAVARMDMRAVRLLCERRENLCDGACFTGYHIDGGFAELAVADHRFCFPIPAGYPDLQAAPLCAPG